MAKVIKKCRVCGNSDLVPVIDLGEHVLTGIFPRQKNQPITTGPLELVKCSERNHHCGLVQLRHSYQAAELYGDHYGYRSSLNRSMVHHLQGIVSKVLEKVQLAANDIALDIGSNDSTLLRAYLGGEGKLVGIDPAGDKFRKYYPEHIKLISDFFSAKVFRKHFGSAKARIVTSIAMFYDLESPMDFMKEVYDILADDGIWAFEQSYMPAMLKMTAYDTICQEHFEYYRLKQIKWMANRSGFKIIHVEFNAANGGSFLVIVAKAGNRHHRENKKLIADILEQEEKEGLSNLDPYRAFQQRAQKHRDHLIHFVRKAKADGKSIFGYGASTKGNVILQYCGFGAEDIPCIAEVNEDKFGCFTPGTGIPIVSEIEAKKLAPDYFLILPWHFKDNIIARERAYTDAGGTLIFPLPHIEMFPDRSQKPTRRHLQ